jgi:hypothetical protein
VLCRRAAIGSSRASDRQLAGRGSGDGSEHHLEDHAGTSPGKRNASHSRIVAGAGSERSGRPRLHRAVCRKRRPVRGVHHCECRAIDRAVSNGERSGDSFESGSKKLHPITPSASRGRQFGAQPVVSQSVPDMLFAVPQGDPGNEPAVDSNASACPKSVADDPCHDRRGPPAASPESEDSVPPTPARSKPAKVKPKAQKKMVPAESDVAGIAPSTDAKGKVRIQSQPRQAPRFPRTNEVARC